MCTVPGIGTTSLVPGMSCYVPQAWLVPKPRVKGWRSCDHPLEQKPRQYAGSREVGQLPTVGQVHACLGDSKRLHPCTSGAGKSGSERQAGDEVLCRCCGSRTLSSRSACQPGAELQ